MLLVCSLNCSKLASILMPFRAANWRTLHGHVLAGAVYLISCSAVLLLVTGPYTVLFFYPLMSCSVVVPDYELHLVLEGGVLLACTVVVVATTTCLVAIAVRLSLQHGRSANLQGIVTVVLVAVVYCVSFLPTVLHSVTQLTGLLIDHVTRYGSVLRLLVYLNNVCNVLVYYASVVSFRVWLRSGAGWLLGAQRRAEANRVIPRNRSHEMVTMSTPRNTGSVLL